MSKWFPRLDRKLCTRCRKCITACPTSALTQVEGKATLTYPNLCTYCAACETICPVGAIELPYLICNLEEYHEQTG